jgi:hypothetical protein
MGLSLELLNEELTRGIDEQSLRHSTRLAIIGLLSGLAVATNTQLLATPAGSVGWRWTAVSLGIVTLALTVLAWLSFECYDVDPSARIDDAESGRWTDSQLRQETFVRRRIAYDLNEKNLSRSHQNLVYRGAMVFGGTSVLLAVLILAVAGDPDESCSRLDPQRVSASQVVLPPACRR